MDCRFYQKKRALPTLALVLVVTAACVSLPAATNCIAQEPAAEPTSKVLLTSEVKWEQLNPARGDKGPKVAFLWGNPQDDQLNGTLVKLPAGFTGKIHSHGSTFRAVVIQIGQPRFAC